MEKIIEIPEGYEARIEGNKVILESKMNEDERMIKAIHIYLDWLKGRKDYEPKGEYSLEDMISWLEKQGNKEYALKSSKDEDVHKFVQYIKRQAKAYELNLPNRSYDIYGFAKDILSWLEKESLQNLANSEKTCKVEPKFKVGDWVIDKQDIVHQIANVVENVTYHTYGYDIVGSGYFNDNTEGVRLWTIKDAKDGDVLATLDYIFIFKKLLPKDGGVSYCHYDFESGNPQFIWFEDKNWYFGKEAIIHPATEEQRDLLFQKMEEAGYGWDIEKKELSKIEQKPADNIIEDEKPLLEKFKQAVYDCAWGKVTCNAEGETKEEYANRWAEHFLLMVRDWADDYIEYTIQQKLRKSYDEGKEDAIKENSPVWSEEDEVKFRDVIRLVEQGAPVQSIRDHYTNWFKSLKERYAWKPSAEQMSQLECVAKQNKDNILGKELMTLFNDLNKLKR